MENAIVTEDNNNSNMAEVENEKPSDNGKRAAKDGADMQTDDKSMPTRKPAGEWHKNQHFGNTVIPGVLNDSETEKVLIEMLVIINGTTFEAELDNGAAAQEFKSMLPLQLKMHELNGNEKYGDLPTGLTQKVYSPGTIHAGDILLWGSDTLVVFYEDFSSSYSYTKIGRITDVSGLKDAVGKNSVQVRFE